MNKYTLIGLFFIALALASCDKSVVFQSNSHVDAKKWAAADSVAFRFEIKEVNHAYNFYFNVRNTTDYSYQNLYLFITTLYPNGTCSYDTAECILAHPDGKWMGKGKGRIKDSRFMFKQKMFFPQVGEYTVLVNHGMRENNLKGIHNIGVEITKPQD